MIQQPITLDLRPGVLISKIKGMKPILIYKQQNHHYPETGERTISGIDLIFGHSVELPTRVLHPINQRLN